VNDPETIVATLNCALDVIDQQYTYIDQLPKKDDGLGEWAKHGTKMNLRGQVQQVGSKILCALECYQANIPRMALNRAFEALNALDELDARLDKIAAEEYKKMGAVACEKIQAYSDVLRPMLETVDSLTESALTFLFNPHGTQFQLPAELVIPFEEILISDELFLYSDDSGTSVEPIELEYTIDYTTETYHFFIDHFSEYYYLRR
jgi:hypothetical protein